MLIKKACIYGLPRIDKSKVIELEIHYQNKEVVGVLVWGQMS